MIDDLEDPVLKPQPPSAGKTEETEEARDVGKGKRKLTPEEQMARYEEALKEDDWGHQPC